MNHFFRYGMLTGLLKHVQTLQGWWFIYLEYIGVNQKVQMTVFFGKKKKQNKTHKRGTGYLI